MKYFSKIIKGYYTDQTPTTPTPTLPYSINLNNQWKLSSISNPDSTQYDIYESFSNYNVNSGVAIMYITIKGYTEFMFYIRSYAESNYDYVMVSQLDKTITGSTSYSDTTLVKAHTRGNQQSGTALSNYTKVIFSDIDEGEHTITVLYRKDSSQHSGDDRGYLLIGNSLESTLPNEEDKEEEDEEAPEINIYVVDKNEVLWEVDDWTGGSNAIGVGLVAGNHRFIIAKEDMANLEGDKSLALFRGSIPYPTQRPIIGGIDDNRAYLPDENNSYNGEPHISNDFNSWNSGAISKFTGKIDTYELFRGESSEDDFSKILKNYNKNETINGFIDWYIPSLGQLALIFLATNNPKFNTAINKVGGSKFPSNTYYWSTAVDSGNTVFTINLQSGVIFTHQYNGGSCFLRTVHDFTKPGTIDLLTAPNGVYVIAKNGKGLTIEDAKFSSNCLGVALITDNQRIMIAKKEVENDNIYYGKNLAELDIPNLDNFSNGTDAKTDFNGDFNTKRIISSYSEFNVEMDSHDMCKVLETFDEDGYNDWYIPSFGQLWEIYSKKSQINNAFLVINETGFTTNTISGSMYWSSTEGNNGTGTAISFFGGSLYLGYSRGSSNSVRFIRNLGPKLISFTINRDTLEYYQAEEGMTFMEWCNSEYNTGNYYCENGTVCVDIGVSIDQTTIIKGNTVINDGVTYEAYIRL